MHTGYAAPAALFGAITALGAWLAQRKARKLKYFQQEELDVGQVKGPGAAKVMGLVASREPMVSPLNGKPCVWYHVLVQEYVNTGRSSHWATVHSAARFQRFQLKDRKGPGTLEVDLQHAEVLLAAEGGSESRETLLAYLKAQGVSRLLGFGELRANETTLQPGEKIYVLGTVAQEGGGYTLKRGDAPFVLSDSDWGQLAYKESNSMYIIRFWAGAAGLMTLWWVWHLLR